MIFNNYILILSFRQTMVIKTPIVENFDRAVSNQFEDEKHLLGSSQSRQEHETANLSSNNTEKNIIKNADCKVSTLEQMTKSCPELWFCTIN